METSEWNPLGYKPLYRELFKKHMARQEELLRRGRPVGWFYTFYPSELIYAFDIVPAFPEQYSAYCAARGSAVNLMNLSTSMGYGRFLCDYFNVSIGAVLAPEKATQPVMPDPDFIVGSRGLCFAHCEMAYALSRIKKVPHCYVTFPYWTREIVGRHDSLTKIPEKIDSRYLNYCVSEIEGLISFLEKVTGENINEEKFREAFKLAEETSKLLIKILELMTSRPTPGSQREICDLVVPGFFVLGSPYAYEFAVKAYELINERVKRGIGVTSEEKIRLLTFGIIPWHSLSLYEYCERMGVTFPVNLFINESVHLVEASKPFESSVRRTIHFTNADFDLMYDVVNDVKHVDLDGALLIENPGCRVSSITVRPLAEIIEVELGIPCLILEISQCDPTITPLERVKMQIEAFIETLES
jgi:benzoyl-CoA reductase/2-hydroxyglutaryl-CoA dehydratase subunit BcrC/BadD/HgdB